MRKKLNESIVACPLCGGKFLVEQFLLQVPHFGEVLITKGECSSCKYATKDIFPVSEGKFPKKQTFVANSSNLDARVIRSPSCRIEIPEIGLTIEPVRGEAFITNVEGLLLRLMEKLKSFKAQGMHVDQHILRIRNVLEGKEEITIIFEDPNGLSFIGGVGNE